MTGPDPWSEEALRHAFTPKPSNGNGHDYYAPPALKLFRGNEALIPQPMGTIVQGVLHQGSLSLFYGPPKSGKSFLLTDMLLEIAAGADGRTEFSSRREVSRV